MKVLVATEKPFAKIAVDGIRKEVEAAGYELVLLEKYTDKAQLLDAVKDANAIIIRSDIIDAEVLDAAKELKIVVRAGAGYDNVDWRYAKEKGIPVMNVPVYGTDNVSQFAVSLLLEVCSHIGHHSDSVYAGEWAENADWCYWHYPMIEVSGKTAGIIGLGRIGVNTAKILKAMNVNVIAYDAFQSEAGKAVAEYVELDELLAKSDFIFLHCPLFPSTQGIIGKENIAKMKDGVIIINNSRGPLIVEQDLYDALESGKVAAAAVDVVSTEPIKKDNVLLKAKNCIITPHISWATKEARERIMKTTAENIQSVMNGKTINAVNL